MKKLLLLLILTPVCALQAQQWGDLVHAMSYNVRHCAGMDDQVNVSRVSRVIRTEDPDIVAVQELDSMCTRSGSVYQLQQMSVLTRLKPTFAKAIPFGGGSYGVGILSKVLPLSVKRVPLPGKEPRVLLICEFETYVFACTHLDLVEENRMASIPIILAEAERFDKPFIMAGDWNDAPTTNFMKELRKSFKPMNMAFLPTFPADKPTTCIDYIAYYIPNGQVRVGTSKVINEPLASDHRPITYDFHSSYVPDGINSLRRDGVTNGPERIIDLSGRIVSGDDAPWKQQQGRLYKKSAKGTVIIR